jgi:hypothetical protein
MGWRLDFEKPELIRSKFTGDWAFSGISGGGSLTMILPYSAAAETTGGMKEISKKEQQQKIDTSQRTFTVIPLSYPSPATL